MQANPIAFALLLLASPLRGDSPPPAPAKDNPREAVEPRDPVPATNPANTGAPADSGQEWSLQKVRDREHPDLAETGHQIHPAGSSIRVGGKILSMALARDGKFLVVKSNSHISVVNADSFELVQQVAFPSDPNGRADSGSMHGIAVSPDGATVFFTGNLRDLYQADLDASGHLDFAPPILLTDSHKTANPLGLAVTPNGKRVIVALSVSNELAVVKLANRSVVSRIPVGVCPYGVELSRNGRFAFVSNFGGSRPHDGDKTENGAGTAIAVDERSVALRGSVSVVDLKTGAVVEEIATGIHPEAMAKSPDGKRLYVVDASGDAISVIQMATRKVIGHLGTKPEPGLPYGSLTNGVALSGGTVFAVNAGNNAVALIDPAKPEAPYAFIPAGGYPGALCVRGNDLFIGNIAGYQGNLQKVTLPGDPAELAKLTAEAKLGFRLPEILRAQERAQTGVAPKPVPDHVGEPSPLKHVVFIIKENKKFDQVFGDIGRGNVEPKFCEFPRSTTPNIHALADDFVLLDNYYCSGVRSSVGHQWTVQGLTTPYREKDCNNVRSPYDFGLDPLSYAGCGFIWDHLLRKGLSFRNFGELGVVSTPKHDPQWRDYYEAWANHTESPGFTNSYQIDTLRRYSDPGFPGWQMAIPDQIRADIFLKALGEFEQSGTMPEFTTIYLPDDHTVGGHLGWPSPRAYVADNDLALGRVVEGLTKSRFWQDMVIFSIQDDPQTGVDHVDGHRSFCLIASPYAKRGGEVVSRFYTQSSVLHTICRIFGVEPMNQLVAMAPVMAECFQQTSDAAPYVCRAAGVELNELNPDPKAAPNKTQATLAPKTLDMDFSKPDLIDADALVFSRWAWSTVRGDEPFPIAYFGAHGMGLPALGLTLDPDAETDTDD